VQTLLRHVCQFVTLVLEWKLYPWPLLHLSVKVVQVHPKLRVLFSTLISNAGLFFVTLQNVTNSQVVDDTERSTSFRLQHLTVTVAELRQFHKTLPLSAVMIILQARINLRQFSNDAAS